MLCGAGTPSGLLSFPSKKKVSVPAETFFLCFGALCRILNVERVNARSLTAERGLTMTTEQRRAAVADAFMQMICETSLDSIRVQDIVQRAGISKATFYRLFHDKYDVMSWIYQSATDPLITASPALKDWRIWSYANLEHIRQHLPFYRKVLGYSGQNSMMESMAQYFQHNIVQGICLIEGVRRLPAKLQFTVEAFSYVNVYAIVWWVRHNCAPSPDTLLSYVESCMPDCLRPYYTP